MASLDFIGSHLVSEFLDDSAHEHNTLLMDIHGDINEEFWKVEITLIFNPLRFRRGKKGPISGNYYGNTSVVVALDLNKNGTLIDYTKHEELTVDKKITKTLKRTYKLALKPEIEFEGAGVKAKVSPGEASVKWEKEAGDESTYEFTEFPLDQKVSKGNSSLEWTIKMPNGKPVVRGYLYGNRYLFADVRWTRKPRKGSLALLAEDPWWFNTKGEKVSSARNWAMKLLAGDSISLQYPNGLTSNFEIND